MLKVRVQLLCSRAARDLILCCCSCSSTSASNCSPSLSKPLQPHNTRNAQPFKLSSLQKRQSTSTAKRKIRKRFHTLELNINVSKLTCSSRFLMSHTGQQDTWRRLIKHEEQFLQTEQPVRPEGINLRYPGDFTRAQRKNTESHEKCLVQPVNTFVF